MELTEAAYETISRLTLAVFTATLLVGTATTIVRAHRYQRAGVQMPRLLKRDLIWMGGMGWTFLLIVFARAIFGAENPLRFHALWVAATSIPPVLAVLTYAYYELFVIERRK